MKFFVERSLFEYFVSNSFSRKEISVSNTLVEGGTGDPSLLKTVILPVLTVENCESKVKVRTEVEGRVSLCLFGYEEGVGFVDYVVFTIVLSLTSTKRSLVHYFCFVLFGMSLLYHLQ